MANKFSRIKHEIGGSWKSKEVLLFGKRGQEPSHKIDENAESQNKNLKGKPTESEIQRNGNDNKKANVKHSGKSNISGRNFDRTTEPEPHLKIEHEESKMLKEME